VVVGINLLREGLDIPEVSLVAVLDADKEGFLRSERSLIQTAGRAARNLNGKVIFYGNRITRSMKAAIDETERRREKQLQFNIDNNITPVGIKKRIKDIIDGLEDVDEHRRIQAEKKENRKYEDFSESEIIKEISKLQKAMQVAARNLEFESAGKIRDQVKYLKEKIYGADIKDKI
jgi:excinuclease ABC subunit B